MEMQLGGPWTFGSSARTGCKRSRGSFGSSRPLDKADPRIGRFRRCSGPRAGDRPGKAVLSGTGRPGRGAATAIRGRKAPSGVDRPALEAGLPCRSRFSDGRCRSSFDPALSGDGRFPSPVSGSRPVRDQQLPRGAAGRSHRPRKAPARAPTRLGRQPRPRRLSGDRPAGGALRAAARAETDPRVPAASRRRPDRPAEALPPRDGLDGRRKMNGRSRSAPPG